MNASSIFFRVFFIKASSYGTAFIIDVDNKQYIVTAKHLFVDLNISNIQYHQHDKWLNLNVRVVGFYNNDIDIIVLAADVLLARADNILKPNCDGLTLAQDVYFLGYPYKMWSNIGSLFDGRAFPLVKKGCISSFPNKNQDFYYIDAINNDGFSGGPVVFMPTNDNDYQVFGVVSKFRTELEQVSYSDNDENTGLTVPYNTGFLVAYEIRHAIDLITKNPIGFQINTNPNATLPWMLNFLDNIIKN